MKIVKRHRPSYIHSNRCSMSDRSSLRDAMQPDSFWRKLILTYIGPSWFCIQIWLIRNGNFQNRRNLLVIINPAYIGFQIQSAGWKAHWNTERMRREMLYNADNTLTNLKLILQTENNSKSFPEQLYCYIVYILKKENDFLPKNSFPPPLIVFFLPPPPPVFGYAWKWFPRG